jgi:hypothetical protein
MGTVLEMSSAGAMAAGRGAGRSRAVPLLAILAVALLGGCAGGDGPSGGETGAEGIEGGAGLEGVAGQFAPAIGRIANVYAGEAPRVSASDPALFTPEAIAAAPAAFRLVQVNALDLVEPARLIRDNGAEETYLLRSGPTAAFDDGILVATRGFGDDLFTMGSQGVLPVLRAGGGQVTRLMESLDPQDQVVTARFDCTISPAGSETVDLGLRQESLRRFDENCRGEALIFDNIYWLDGAGAVVASRQYVSPSVAYLRANRL